MGENMVITGENLYYDAKLQKRPSWETYCDTAAIDAVVAGTGTVRDIGAAYINSAWRTAVAIDNGTTTSFYLVTNATTLSSALQTPAAGAFTFTKDQELQMVEFDNKIVVINTAGGDKPAVIYYDGSNIVVQRLEAFDSRARGNDDWYAGQWDDSETPEMVDDTADAQSDTADDFAFATATNNDGFYVAGVLPFTKVIMTGATDLGSTVSAEYTYYAGGGTWTSVGSLVTTPDWVAAEANKTVEFNIPLDSDGGLAWKKYGDVSTDKDPTGVPGGAINRYIFRIRFTTADSAGTCDKLTVSHEQYLTQLFQGDTIDVVAVHGDRCFLASGNVFAKSLGGINGLKGWSARDFEYTDEGGEDIIAMHSGGQFLAIVKTLGYYRYYGTTTANAVLRFGGPEGGVSTRGACGLKDGVAYIGKKGVYYLSYQGDASLISKSISSALSPASGDTLMNWEGDLLMSDPSADTLYWADPDTLRQDDMGDFTMSWWKWTGQNCRIMIYDYDAIGSARQIMAYDGDNGRLVKNGTNAYDTATSTTQTNIECTLQPKYDAYGTPTTKKRFVRVKLDISKSGDWTLTMYSDNGVNSSSAYTVESGTGTGHYYTDISIPWELDGNNFTIKLVNKTANSVEIYGFSVMLERRVF